MSSRFNALSLQVRLLLSVMALILTMACLLPSGSLKPSTPSLPTPTATLTSTPIQLPTSDLNAAPVQPPTELPTPLPTVTLPYATAESILGDLCFDYLRTLVGKTLILDSESDLIALYDQVDKSKKCDDPVTRGTFDFTAQQIVGSVFADQACDVMVSHESTALDDTAHLRIITLRATLLGECEYDLVYPIWFALDRPPATYTTQIQFIK